MGDIADYEAFHDELDKVWRECYRVLVPGGRVVCVVGDVCIARRVNKGRHVVYPLHADIGVRARKIGFDYLTPILWNKIANGATEAEGNGSGFYGKPYEPNAIIKNDIEYIIFLRKSGGYRQPTEDQRARSRIGKDEYQQWFRSVWTGLTGASTREHPAPYPVELAYRLIRMFSFVDDTVLDPFMGTGSTVIGAIKAERNSIGNELDPKYFALARQKIEEYASPQLLGRPTPTIEIRETAPGKPERSARGKSRNGRARQAGAPAKRSKVSPD